MRAPFRPLVAIAIVAVLAVVIGHALTDAGTPLSWGPDPDHECAPPPHPSVLASAAGGCDPLADPQRQAIVPSPATDDPGLLRVVDDATGAAIGNVDVLGVALPGPGSHNLLAWHEARGACRERFERLGTAMRADAHGIVHGSVPEGTIAFRCEHGGLVGRACASAQHRLPVTLRLEAVRRLRVRVLDDAGLAAAGVPVVVRVAHGDAVTEDLIGAVTADDGNAVLEAVPARLFGSAATVVASVTVAVPVADAPAVALATLDADAVPDVMLRLPATGTVVLRVLDERCVCDDLFVTLAVRGIDQAVGGVPAPATIRVLRGQDREVRVPYVGLGAVVAAQVESAVSHRRSNATFDGPMTRAELVHATITLGDEPRRLTARVCSADGRPIAGGSVRAELSGQTLSGTTDAVGNLTIPLPSAGSPMPGCVTFRHRFDRCELAAQVRSIVNGTRELHCGTVRLVPVLPDVAGRVVDAEGRGLPAVVLQLVADGQVPVTCTTADDGSFAMFLPSDARESTSALLQAVTGGFATTPAVRVRRHDQGIRLVLIAGACIEGTAQPRELALHPALSWLVHSTPVDRTLPALQANGYRGATVDLHGGFRCDGLTAGNYSVLLAVRGDREPVLRFDGVTPGDHDARLAAIDLRAPVVATRVHVCDPHGEAIRGFRLHRVVGGLAAGDAIDSDLGDLSLLSNRDRLQAVVVADGYRPALIALVAGEQNVVLERGRRLNIMWLDTAVASELSCVWSAPADSNGFDVRRFAPSVSTTLLAGRSVAAVLPGDGVYRVTSPIGTVLLTVTAGCTDAILHLENQRLVAKVSP